MTRINENVHTGHIGDPGTAKGTEGQYVTNNVNAYGLDNEDKLLYIQKAHLDHHNKGLGYNHYNPTEIRIARNHHLKSNGVMKEATSTNKEVIEARKKVGKKLDEIGRAHV